MSVERDEEVTFADEDDEESVNLDSKDRKLEIYLNRKNIVKF